jgi:hypothetical protein
MPRAFLTSNLDTLKWLPTLASGGIRTARGRTPWLPNNAL